MYLTYMFYRGNASCLFSEEHVDDSDSEISHADRAGGAVGRVSPVLSGRLSLGGGRDPALARNLFRPRNAADTAAADGVARARDGVRLRGGDGSRLSVDCDPELDRAYAVAGRTASLFGGPL